MSDPCARGHRCDASGNVLGQARDERWRFDRFSFGTQVVAIITFTGAFPGCGRLERSSARGASQRSVKHSMLRNVGRLTNAASVPLVPCTCGIAEATSDKSASVQTTRAFSAPIFDSQIARTKVPPRDLCLARCRAPPAARSRRSSDKGEEMTWLVQPRLVNDPFSDPALFIDFRFGRRALLFDLGDVTALSARELLRVSHAFVSHTHMDHFAGFDRLLRLCLHRTTPLHLVGPAGFLDQVEHKLRAYNWNLLDEDSLDFTLTATEFTAGGVGGVCGFRARETFRRRELALPPLAPGTLLDEEEFRIESVVL